MTNMRYVKQNTDGLWEVIEKGHKRGVIQVDTQSQALARARSIVGHEGGGEVRVVDRTGKIERFVSVPAATNRRAA